MHALIKGFVIIRFTHSCLNQKRNKCIIESWNASAEGTCDIRKTEAV